MDQLSLGERVQLARTRRKLSRQELAGLAGISASYLKKIELGYRSPEMQVVSKLVDALNIPDLRQLLGQPFAVAADGRAEHPSIEGIRAALAWRAALSPQPGALPDLDRLGARVDEAWSIVQAPGAWRYAHTGSLLPGLIRDSETALRAHHGLRGENRARRLTVMVHLLVRPFVKWVGQAPLALIPAERGMTLAEQSSDLALIGAAAWNLAQAQSTLGHPDVTRQIAESAIGHLRVAAGRADAPAGLLSAFGALNLIGSVGALRGDDLRGALMFLNNADVVAARLGADRNDYRLAFGPTNVAQHRIALEVEQGHSRLALSGAARLAADRSPSVERRVALRLDVAQSHARVRQDVAAHAVLLDAESLSPEQVANSVTAREAMLALLRRDRRNSAPELYPLARRMGLIAA